MKSCSAKKEIRGAALIEFAVVFPLLVLLLVGVYSLGRAIAQLAWLSQSSYAAVVAGGESVRSVVESESTVTFQSLFNVLNGKNGSQLGGPDSDSGMVTTTLDQAKRLVTVNVDVQTVPLAGMWSLPMRLETVGPLLTLERAPGNLSTFENVSPCPGGAPLQYPCGNCSCPASPNPKPPPQLGGFPGLPEGDMVQSDSPTWTQFLADVDPGVELAG